MKSRIVTAWAFALLGAAVAPAQSSGVKITLDDPAKPAAPATSKIDPNKPAGKADAKKKADAQKDEMGKIEGIEIPRGGGFLGLQIVNGAFKLTAYDAKKKPVAADFTRVALRWTASYQPNPERTLLTPGGGVGSFTSAKIVKPPHAFKLFITLIKGDGDDAPVENLTVDFRA